MKLYATTTSERASKGQGGNKEIVTRIDVGDKFNPKTVAQVKVKVVLDEYWLIADILGQHIEFYLDKKGEQKKGEIYHHDIGNQYNGVKCSKDCPIHRNK